MPNYLLYSPEVETIQPEEQETFQKIVDLMSKGVGIVREKTGKSVRISHAKAFAVLKGKLVVESNLPVQLAQGIFSKPATYDVLVRMANAPGEINDDSKVTSARGMSIKVLGVSGQKLVNETDDTQDWVLDTGKEFIASNAKEFLVAFQPNATIAPKLSDTVKGAVSSIASATNQGLNALGVNSQKLDFYGHPQKDPMGEPYFSQTALRYGDYVAKLGVYPDTPGMKALAEEKFDPQTPNALREATAKFFASNDAEFSVRVQLNTGLDDMPVENAQAPWPETESQYTEVARLILPAQTGWDPTLDSFVENFSFNPANSIEAHRPLGSVNRARMVAYKALSQLRLRDNGQSMSHITDTDKMPA